MFHCTSCSFEGFNVVEGTLNALFCRRGIVCLAIEMIEGGHHSGRMHRLHLEHIAEDTAAFGSTANCVSQSMAEGLGASIVAEVGEV